MSLAGAACIRVLHISDLHIRGKGKGTAFPGLGHDPALAVALARFIFERRDQFDAILITGDLTDWGHDKDFSEAERYMFSPVGSKPTGESYGWYDAVGKPTLQGKRPECPIFIMPGNHDRYRNATGGPGSAHFETCFGQNWDDATPKRYRSTVNNRVKTVEIPSRDGKHSLAIVLGDFTLRTSKDAKPEQAFEILGQGYAGTQDINQLRKATTDARQVPADHFRAVVWAIHFPPAQVQQNVILRHFKRVVDLSIERDVHVPLVLAGHIHEDSTPYWPRGRHLLPQVWCAGAATSRQIPSVKFTKAANTAHILEFTFAITNGVRKVDLIRRNFKFQQSNVTTILETVWQPGASHMMSQGMEWTED